MGRLAKLALQRPGAVSVVLLAVTALLVSMLPQLEKRYGYRVLLGGDHPAIERLESVMERYGGGYPAYIVWRCGDGAPCETVFDPASVEMAESVEAALLRADVTKAVIGPISAPLLVPADDGFAAMQYSDVQGLQPSDQADFVRRALRDPSWRNEILSGDARTGAIIVLSADARSRTMERVSDATFAAIAPYEAQGWRFYLSGKPVEGIVAGKDLAASTEALTPLIAVIVAAIVWALTRSWQATLVTMATMGVALLWTFGFLAWMGWPQDSILEVLAPLIMTIGTCDAVHLLSRTTVRIPDSATRSEVASALLAASDEVGPACVITTLTTAAALASFATSNLGTFVRFGTTAAFGTLACLVLTFTLLPILAQRLSLRGRREVGVGWDRVLSAIADTAENRAPLILAATLIVTLVCGYGLVTKLRVDTEVSEMYGDQNRVTQWTRFIERHLRGLESLEVDVRFPSEETVLLPGTQETLGRMMSALEEQPGLGRAYSVRTVLAQLNEVVHGGDAKFRTTADSIQGNAELLELASFDSPEVLDSWISPSRRNVRISVEAASAEPPGSKDLADRLRSLLVSIAPADWEVTLTGSYILDIEWVNEVQTTQVRSFGTAFAIVLVLVTVFLRSVWLGLAATVPALVPVVLILGFLGWTGLPLDVGRLMIAAIVIGIGVDDGIHLLRTYQALRGEGVGGPQAMRLSLQRVGRALVVTSLALALGFVALTLSAWQTISSFGFFVCIAVLAALAGALFVLPAIVYQVWRVRGIRGRV